MTTGSTSNRRMLIAGVALMIIFLCLCLAVGAAGGYFFFQQSEETTTAVEPGVEYVLDVSSRMALPAEGSDESRLVVARTVMAEVIRPSRAAVAGLRLFGSGAAVQPCEDTDLVVPLTPAGQQRIAQELESVAGGPAPDSALAQAMIAAIRDLAAIEGPRSLVVVTGGQDSCQAEAGRLIAQEAERAGIELRTFVIGFQVPANEGQAIKDMVAATGNSTYLDAPDEAALMTILQTVQAYADNPTSETLAAVELFATPDAPAAPPTAVADAAVIATPDVSAPPADTPQPDTQPTATLPPTPTQFVAPTPESGYAAETACDHPYFPLRQGAHWVYAGHGDGESYTWTWTVLEVTGDLENATATIEGRFDDELTITYHWECTPEGIISYDFGAFAFNSLDLEGVVFDFEITSSEGVFLPAPDLFAPGATWDNNYTIATTFSMEGQSFSSTLQQSGSYTAVAFESITTPAGSFDALRVDSRETTTTSMFDQSNTFNSSQSQWYAEGVGWIRMVTTSEGSTSTIELVSYTAP